MSKREEIVSKVVELIDKTIAVRTVTREPKSLDELSSTAFPHVLVETANETRESASIGGTIRRVSDMEILLNVVVRGANRDQQRNAVIDAIEKALSSDASLGGVAYDSGVTDISIREIAESAPYGQAAIIFSVRYFYDTGNP